VTPARAETFWNSDTGMSVITKKISNDSTVSGYKVEGVLFEECASQEQENVSNQRGEKL